MPHISYTNTYGKMKPKLCENSWKSTRNIDTVIRHFGFYDIFVHPPPLMYRLYLLLCPLISFLQIFNIQQIGKFQTRHRGHARANMERSPSSDSYPGGKKRGSQD